MTRHKANHESDEPEHTEPQSAASTMVMLEEADGTTTSKQIDGPSGQHEITVDGKSYHHVGESDDGVWIYRPL